MDSKRHLIIGDIHGCLEELSELISKAKDHGFDPFSNSNDKFVFVGDWVDRGPFNDKTLEFVCDLIVDGHALSVIGNHEEKLRRYLKGNDTKLKNGLETTVNQLEAREDVNELKKKAHDILWNLPYYIVLDDGKLVVVHAGIQDRMLTWDKEDKFMKRFTIYGDITGKQDEYGFPERLDWTLKREVKEDSPLIVYGHMPQLKVYESNKTIYIDTGSCFGNILSGHLYPEMKFFEVHAKKEYWEYRNGLFKKETS